ncbi:phosphoglycerate dehydrogenase [Hymenobacter busanensis]|uniref:Phosphoglycerate dehydrogenase n=1 Tax=Hymenobacter busanensis TaxID=2607656 RepID=A0A7L4ZUP3_9BACT|nr:NAD(P)-dependent oxidoreductase [Hymenobacter busanensis]KAA9339582.1 phosphoglycerate dehydrogenase [Hymenobacter busanensis]QHJ06663.1 phosphoglycerate dehydrogenase [Hymenobacter busanensis]
MSICLVIDEMHPTLKALLKAEGVQIDYDPDLLPAEVPAALAEKPYEGLIVRSKVQVTAQLLRHGKHLRYVARAGAGIDNIDMAALDAAGVQLINAPEGNSQAVGEFTVGLLLALLRKVAAADAEVRNGQWRREANRGYELSARTVGIIGCGHMGQSFASCLRGFGCQVLGFDNDPAVQPTDYLPLVPLDELQQRADVLSIHIPYSTANHGFVNEGLLRGFRRPLWLLNTARGEVLDHAALAALLQQGHVRGAALDVLDNERIGALKPEQQARFGYLRTAPNVVLTPHVAGWTHESYQRINEVLARKIGELMRG